LNRIELLRDKKLDEYVFISQVLFLLLAGILLVRVWEPAVMADNTLYKNILILVFPILGLILVRGIEKSWYNYKRLKVDNVINAVYLVCIVFLLTYERESFFKFLLLMPVVVSSLQYGTKVGYYWALFGSLGIVIIDYIHSATQMDVDILVIGVLWLFAWLLGKMSETELEVREELQRLAAIDGLTGVYNHRSFYDFLDEYMTKTKKTQKSLTLIMLDADFFKYYNDAYGHQKGDEVLHTLATLINDEIKEVGLCARYGGDEFAVLLPGCEGKVGLKIGEKIRKRVEESEFEGAKILPGGRFTVSVGVASFPEHCEDKEHLIQKADEALYKAKHTKANKVELYYSVFDEIGHSLQGKERDLLNSMRTLLMVVNAKDRYTYGHSERVMQYALQIGKKMTMWEWEIQNLMIGALLHDIGKIEITREILNKPGKLTASEWQAIRQHSVWGADMIRPVTSISGAVDVVLYHHENYDGTGYPYSLKANDIPLGARILRLADSFDAMTSTRPYKKTVSLEGAIQDIIMHKGTFYDPDVVDAFIEHLEETKNLSEAASL